LTPAAAGTPTTLRMQQQQGQQKGMGKKIADRSKNIGNSRININNKNYSKSRKVLTKYGRDTNNIRDTIFSKKIFQ
jgi:hypothetical protein